MVRFSSDLNLPQPPKERTQRQKRQRRKRGIGERWWKEVRGEGHTEKVGEGERTET